MVKLKPIIVIFAGAPCTGKTITAKGLAEKIDNSFIIEKDDINRALLYMKPVDAGGFGRLQPTEEYLESCYGPEIHKRKVRGLMSEVLFSLPWGGPYYARHVRDQTYQAMTDIARLNLELGKVPIVASIASNHFSESYPNFVKNFIDSFPRSAMVYMHLPEEILRKRVIARMEREPERKEVDYRALKDDTWKEELKRIPVFPPNLDDFEHYKISALQSPEKCAEQAFEYIYNLAKK